VIGMKIAHIGDAHWGLGYPGPAPESRFEDITRVMRWSAEKMIAENVDLVLFAGDAFKDSKVMLDRATREIKAFAEWLRLFSARHIPVVVISGTPSHDAISAYELIDDMRIPGVEIHTRPALTVVRTRTGKAVNIACLPGLNRSNIVTKEEFRDLTPKEIHQVMTQKLRDLCWGLHAQADPEYQTVLLSHMTYAGADTGFDELLQEHEPILTQEAVSPFGLVCLGHIHRPQLMLENDPSVCYCGSPERLTFNDEAVEPGFWLHYVDEPIESAFFQTPARPFVTIDIPGGSEKAEMFAEGIIIPVESLDGAVVRIRAELTEGQAKMVDRKAMERLLYDAGAFFVAEIRIDVERAERSRDREVTEGLGPVQAVERWGLANEKAPDEIAVLQSMTARLCEEVRS
jgi:exonuclease SbcD